jgi:hypothetical protein
MFRGNGRLNSLLALRQLASRDLSAPFFRFSFLDSDFALEEAKNEQCPVEQKRGMMSRLH